MSIMIIKLLSIEQAYLYWDIQVRGVSLDKRNTPGHIQLRFAESQANTLEGTTKFQAQNLNHSTYMENKQIPVTITHTCSTSVSPDKVLPRS